MFVISYCCYECFTRVALIKVSSIFCLKSELGDIFCCGGLEGGIDDGGSDGVPAVEEEVREGRGWDWFFFIN